MHLKFSYFLLHTLIYRFSERKHVFIHKTVHVLGLVMHVKIFVDFGRKVYLVDCLL